MTTTLLYGSKIPRGKESTCGREGYREKEGRRED